MVDNVIRFDDNHAIINQCWNQPGRIDAEVFRRYVFLLENIEVVALPLEAFLLKHHADTHGAVRNTTVEKMEARVTQDLLIGWHNNSASVNPYRH